MIKSIEEGIESNIFSLSMDYENNINDKALRSIVLDGYFSESGKVVI